MKNQRKRKRECTFCGKVVFDINRHLRRCQNDAKASYRQYMPDLVVKESAERKKKVSCLQELMWAVESLTLTFETILHFTLQ